jgi:uncharacterized protein
VHLEHSFSVPVGIEEAWEILLDIERVGPCMPGAAIDSVDGDSFTGTVKVKLGPINLTYKGHASFVEKDATARRAVIDARGRDARGNGTASALVTATLADVGGTTKVDVHTDLDITGKPAQFGRGVMVDVGNKLIGQFADALAKALQTGEGAAAPPEAEAIGAATPAVGAAGAPQPAEAAAKASETSGAASPAVPESSAGDAPAYSVPGGVPAASPASMTSANGRPVLSGSEPQGEVEPINLLHHAGPAVAKRLAPVAVAGLVVLVAVRRRKRSHSLLG